MPTVKLVEEAAADARVKAIYHDIKMTKKIDQVPNFWRALAANPDNLERCWNQAKAIMKPGALDLLTKEIIALAVSITNSCRYCISSHTAASQKLGMTPEQFGEFLAVVGLYNQFNKMVDAFQVEPDILPVV